MYTGKIRFWEIQYTTWGSTICYKIAEGHNSQAWFAREDFSKEVTLTLRPEGTMGIIQKRMAKWCTRRRQKMCEDLEVKLSMSYLNN